LLRDWFTLSVSLVVVKLRIIQCANLKAVSCSFY